MLNIVKFIPYGFDDIEIFVQCLSSKYDVQI